MITYKDTSKNPVTRFTDALGLTDTRAGDRAIRTMRNGLSQATDDLDVDTLESYNLLREGMKGRSLGSNLSDYNDTISGSKSMLRQAGDLSLGQQNAGSQDNVYDYLNPKMDLMLSKTQQKMQGGAGSALQSSAATKATANAVSEKAGDIWDTAYEQALGDARNNLDVANQYGNTATSMSNIAGNALDYNNEPFVDFMNLENDKAMAKYAGNIGMTQAQGKAAGQDRSILGSIVGVVK